MPEVKLVNVVKKYRDIVALDHLNLKIHDKEYLTIVGPTGAGKTTTLMIIAGLIKPDEGEVYINGRLVNNVLPEDRGIGFVFQNFILFPNMNVWDNVIYGPLVKGIDLKTIRKTAHQMLELVQLAGRPDALPNELSGGMQQRVALVRALTSGAKLLLMDEPLGSLDAKIRMNLRYELRKLVKELGLTAIHVTHDTEEALTISDRIAILRKGKILQVGTPREVYDHPANLFVANFIGESNFLVGIVSEIDEQGSLIKVDDNIIRVLHKKWKKGSMVVIMVRAEDTNLAEGEVKTTNGLYGYVEEATFISGYIRYEIRLDNGLIIVTKKIAGENTPFKVGDRVTVYFKPDHTLGFLYPEEGLKKAFSLE